MKAVIHSGALKASVEDVPDPRIEDPQDVIIKITTANICGSDLHMYEGRTNAGQGKILGHENMGVVVETGDAGPPRPRSSRMKCRSPRHRTPTRSSASGWTATRR